MSPVPSAAATGRDPVVRLTGVTHRYGGTLAADDVSLDLPAGKMVGFIGPDGVGKSTWLGLMAGARKVQSGEVMVLGGDMRDKRHRERLFPRIAYMPQGLGKNLYPTLSVRENIDFFGRLFGQSRPERERRIRDLLHSTGMGDFADRPAQKLSGGMRQKLSLCCALVHDPDLLILDEPTTGVDPLSRRQFWELIGRIRAGRPGMSVLIATAYMEEAGRFDWLVAVDDGGKLAEGTPAELLERTGAEDLEGAFLALLPEKRKRGHHALTIPPLDKGETVIEAAGLTMRFGNFTAVDHVDLSVDRGEIFGFIGSNGCGKSTTMKMLTGLLEPTLGEARLLGRRLDARNMATRRRVGYMSQAFSLYGELSVRRNLELHAKLFHLPPDEGARRVEELEERFGLARYRDDRPEDLPLGIRQRLQLAVAVLHNPDVLILDEPTSGVDPVARDRFWELIIDLSRKDGVTIFISTHFMNEASRCDRVALMHAGRILDTDTPRALREKRGAASLEEAFIAYLEDASGETGEAPAGEGPFAAGERGGRGVAHPRFSPARLLSFTIREAMELKRDPIRLGMALFGTLILMLVMGYGINLDVEDLSFAALDQDQTTAGHDYILEYEGSRYFSPRPPVSGPADLDRRMVAGELSVVIQVPPDFGRDLDRGDVPEAGAWIDGAMPSRAEIARGYVQGVHNEYLSRLAALSGRTASLYGMPVRYRYNPEMKSIISMVPKVIPLLLVFIPAMLTALGVVREKEMGSILNVYTTPVTKFEFLVGKQLPYITLSLINFAFMFLLAVTLFRVPFTGSLPTLALGALAYVAATTGLGLLASTLTSSQVAAIAGTAIFTLLPAIQFSGLIDPVSTLEGVGRLVGSVYPTTYYLLISEGTFSKGLGLARLAGFFWPILAAIPVTTFLSVLFLREQGGSMRTTVLGGLSNIFTLGVKEFRSLLYDKAMLFLILFMFTGTVYADARAKPESLNRATVAVVDEDRSQLSGRIIAALHPPQFMPPVHIGLAEMDKGMDSGRYTFVLDIPPDFQRDVAAGRTPDLQLNVDATRLSQAQTGTAYLQNIVDGEIRAWAQRYQSSAAVPVRLNIRVFFNPNVSQSWFAAINSIVNNITLLGILLTGAALIRENEHGTIEHLLVMPVTPLEIMVSKVWSMGLVVLAVSTLSLYVMVEGVLGVTLNGSTLLFACCTLLYLFAAASIGIYMATLARTMPQFGLLAILVLLPLEILSGGTTPRESMPQAIQWVMSLAPTTHYVSLAQAILFRGAGPSVIWPDFLGMAGIGTFFFWFAHRRLRRMIGSLH